MVDIATTEDAGAVAAVAAVAASVEADVAVADSKHRWLAEISETMKRIDAYSQRNDGRTLAKRDGVLCPQAQR